ncbi:hypothetical protein ACLQ28_03785 [Micromonospora sp. DT201]|uniref:hypothetical protein n=1 Tax=Micromonospora sp. DT201 TaxID=3393442 RepID=UPI003CF63F7B
MSGPHRERVAQLGVLRARTALRGQEPAASGEANFAHGSALPPTPYGHPDLVLVRAVRLGVITVAEAELIGGTFLEDVSLAAYAERSGLPSGVSTSGAAPPWSGSSQRPGPVPLSDPTAEVTGTTAPEASSRHRH